MSIWSSTGVQGGLHMFYAVLAWCRIRFVRFADNERAETTLALLAECFQTLGGVPGVVLADRTGCLKGGVVANRAVPTGAYLPIAAYHGFRPDFCEAADPESKGILENPVGYAKTDLMIPGPGGVGDPFTGLRAANAAAPAWCVEVNGVMHSEICAVPAERLVTDCARGSGGVFRPARAPGRWAADEPVVVRLQNLHDLLAPLHRQTITRRHLLWITGEISRPPAGEH